MFPELGVRDETQEFGALASGDRRQGVRAIIEHRTESPSMEATRNAYRSRIRSGGHVGAHYLIGQDGSTSLTVPTNRVVGHLRGNRDPAYRGANGWSIGIENVGMATQLNRNGNLRQQVEGLSLPPAMRQRLLSQNDAQLRRTLGDSNFEMHTDITGPQRRANWNLVNRLVREHGLDLATDVRAHEHVDHKTLGEAEPLTEFFGAMRSYPDRVRRLGERLAQLEANPNVPRSMIEEMRGVLQREQTTQAALQVDATANENTAMEGERMAGIDGPASARERNRTDFYDNFWQRSQDVDRWMNAEDGSRMGPR